MIFYFKKQTLSFFSATLFLFFCLFIFKQSHANVVAVVDDSSGVIANNGLCSITEAFLNFLNGDQSGSTDCPAGDIVTPDIINVINLETDVVLSDEWPSAAGGYLLGFGAANLTINGNGYSISRDPLADDLGILRLVGFSNYEFNNVTFSGGNTDSVDPDINKGGALAIFSPQSVVINNSTFENNAAVEGGAVYIRKDSAPAVNLEINNSVFESNSADDGSALYLDTIANFDINNTSFDSNSGVGNGNSIYILNSQGDIANSFFSNSGTAELGGALYLSGSEVILQKSLFDRNFAVRGGAIYLTGGSLLTAYNNFFNDSYGFNGGGTLFSYQLEGGSQNQINFYHNTVLNTFDGVYGGGAFVNCIDDGADCFGDPFGVISYVFENNIFGEFDSCDGVLSDASFLNNLGDAVSGDCGVNDDPTGLDVTLEENGGPFNSFAIMDISNALDSAVVGSFGCPDTDARGFPRPFGAACDIGAFEYDGEQNIIISETDGVTIVNESGGSDSYSIFLEKAPSSDVVIDLTKSDSDFNISPSSLTFTTLNWFNPQSITVSAIDNTDVDGDRDRTITHTIVTLDTDYALIVVDDVEVSIIDDDIPAPISTSSSGSSVTIVQPTSPEVEPILGCTIISALNYNPLAVQNDGSCIFPEIEISGCINFLALNYNPAANIDDGSCIFPVIDEPQEIENELDDSDVVLDNEEINSENNQSQMVDTNEDIQFLDEIEDVLSKETDDKFFREIFGGVLGESVLRISENASFVGLVVPGIIFVVTQPAVAASIPIRLWSLFPTLLGIKRRRRPWGTVYDSITKQPLDPVHVSLVDDKGVVVESTITDIDGRFGFIVRPGKYKLLLNKDGYIFPSQKMRNKQKDDLYGDLYFGEYINIEEQDDLLVKNIPMDPVNFNWNEFEKAKNKKLMKFYSKREVFFANVSNFIFYAGFLSSILILMSGALLLNFIILSVYLIIFVLRFLNLGPKKPGYVFDEKGFPLSYGIIKVFSSALDREIAHCVVGKTGKYYILVRNGEYYLKIIKKTGEDSYVEIYKTNNFSIRNGYIGKNFNL